jgi:molecular chaperone DnaK
MAREAEQHSAEDKRRRELVEARNPTDAAIYAAERQLQEHGGRVGDTERKSVEDAVAALREAVAGDGIGRIRQRPEALSLALPRLCEAMHRGAAAAGQTAGGPGAGDKPLMGGDDVVDAEFVDVDEPRRHQR